TFSARQVSTAHEVAGDRSCRLPALADGPYDEALAAAHIAGNEELVTAPDAVVAVIGLEALEASACDHGQVHLPHDVTLDGPREAHGEQHEIGIERTLGARSGLELAVDPRVVELLDLAVLAREARRRDRVLNLRALGLARGDAQ